MGNFFEVVDNRSESRWRLPIEEWSTRVKETVPGAAAPRPTFAVGAIENDTHSKNIQARHYRVGPLSRQAVVGNGGVSPHRAQLRLLVDTAVAAREFLNDAELLGEKLRADGAEEAVAAADFKGTRTGIGVVDGPRGLLVHSYTAAADGIITDCQIMTPTAQNEFWLTQMLTEQLREQSTTVETRDGGDDSKSTGGGQKCEPQDSGIEESIWAADPCLPCSSAPAGVMSFRFQEKGAATTMATKVDGECAGRTE